jgi:DNA-binding XRE family transcriptional regulator
VSRTVRKSVKFSVVDLDGVRYAILRERLLLEICGKAGIQTAGESVEPGPGPSPGDELEQFDGDKLALRLVARRERLGWTQAELARRAGVRAETLNRLERGRTTPDFATIRKLVMAMKQIEAELRL